MTTSMRNKCLPSSSETETTANRNVFQQHVHSGERVSARSSLVTELFLALPGEKNRPTCAAGFFFFLRESWRLLQSASPLLLSSEPENRKDFHNVEMFDSNICFLFLTPISTYLPLL